MTNLLLLRAEEGIGKAVEPVLSTLAQTLLGAICLLAVFIAAAAVWKLSRVQDKRAEDATASSKRVEDVTEKMTKAFGEMTKTVDALVRAVENGQRLQQEQMNLLQQMKNSLDTTIRDVALAGSRYGRYPSTSAKPPPPKDE